MSYIYRYQLRNKIERENCDLRNYKIQLDDMLNKCFYDLKGNKTYCVDKEYFEFRTYKKKTRMDLQNMGKILKFIFKDKYEHGFIRSKIRYYAYISKEYNSNNIIAEIIEFNELNDALQKYYSEQMENSRESIISELDLGALFIDLDNDDYRNFCLPIDKLKRVDNEWCIIEGINRINNNKNIILERDLINYNSLTDQIENLDGQNASSIEDEGFSITNTNILSKEQTSRINEFFEFKYETARDLKTIQDDFKVIVGKSEKLIIKNVGQGLSCSICDKDDKANIYFDIGRGARNNKKTTPANLTYNFDNNPIIILSHIDEDHWASVREFQKALDMKWIVPNQKPKVSLRKIYSILGIRNNLYAIDGMEYNINDCGLVESFILFNGTKNGKEEDTHPHNNGFSIFIELRNKIRILLPGDNRYEYISSIYKENINILCATHHGGEYTSDKEVILCPVNDNEKIIYSFGIGNSHSHPSKVEDYEKAKWIKKHETPSGEYIYDFSNVIV